MHYCARNCVLSTINNPTYKPVRDVPSCMDGFSQDPPGLWLLSVLTLPTLLPFEPLVGLTGTVASRPAREPKQFSHNKTLMWAIHVYKHLADIINISMLCLQTKLTDKVTYKRHTILCIYKHPQCCSLTLIALINLELKALKLVLFFV